MSPARTKNPATDSLFAEIESDTARRLLEAALAAFAQRGYHATTTRDISTGAGLSPAALYVHYASKAKVLYELSRIGHQAVLGAVEESLSEGEDPQTRIWNLVFAFTRWHAEHNTLARVLQYELDSLPPDGREKIVTLRRQVDRLVDKQLRAGSRAHQFEIRDQPGTRRAILSLGIDVGRWYGPDEHRSPTAVGTLYADLVSRMLAP